MSQNKTVIQGLEPETNLGNASGGAGSNFYSRGRQSNARGTVVPGMTDAQSGNQSGSSEAVSAPQTRKVVQPGKPIVGFLYSISRTRLGEYWPLQMGRNTIGQSADSNIQLAEGTVSSNHAVIVTRQVKGGIIAAITDSQSTNGTMINGETIGFGAEECHDGDIITIGNNYEFVLILIDAEKRGLKASEGFIPVDVEGALDEETEDIPSFPGGMTRPGGFDPYNDVPAAWGNNGGGYSPNDGTVGMDGSVSGGNQGGTVSM